MTSGTLVIDGQYTATVTGNGWESADPEMSTLLNGAFLLPGDERGDPVVRAFSNVLNVMGKRARVVIAPIPGTYPPVSVNWVQALSDLRDMRN